MLLLLHILVLLLMLQIDILRWLLLVKIVWLVGPLELGIKEDHPLVHDLEVLGHLHEVTPEFAQQVVHLARFNFDDVTLWPVNVLR